MLLLIIIGVIFSQISELCYETNQTQWCDIQQLCGNSADLLIPIKNNRTANYLTFVNINYTRLIAFSNMRVANNESYVYLFDVAGIYEAYKKYGSFAGHNDRHHIIGTIELVIKRNQIYVIANEYNIYRSNAYSWIHIADVSYKPFDNIVIEYIKKYENIKTYSQSLNNSLMWSYIIVPAIAMLIFPIFCIYTIFRVSK